MSKIIFWGRKIFFFEKILADTHFKIEAKVEVDVRLVKRDDFPRIAKRFKMSEIEARERFEVDHMCIIADLHGDFVHLKWFAFNETYSGNLERELRISSDSV